VEFSRVIRGFKLDCTQVHGNAVKLQTGGGQERDFEVGFCSKESLSNAGLSSVVAQKIG
jgi:hypothetical protein